MKRREILKAIVAAGVAPSLMHQLTSADTEPINADPSPYPGCTIPEGKVLLVSAGLYDALKPLIDKGHIIGEVHREAYLLPCEMWLVDLNEFKPDPCSTLP